MYAMVSYHFRKWCSTPRMYILLLFLLFVEDMYLSSIREFSELTGEPVTVFSLPLLTVLPYFSMLVFFGVIILFGNAPFMERAQLYRVVRAGKTRWAVAQVIYIFLASLTYFLVLFVLGLLLILPYVTWENGWGKVYNTLAQTNAGAGVNMDYSVSYHVVLGYQPWEALGLVILIGTLAAALIGLMMFTGSIWVSRNVGLCLGSYVPVSTVSLMISNGILWYFTPGAWLNLEVIGWQENGISPTIPQVILILATADLVLSVLAVLRVRTMDIPVYQDV